MKSEDKSKFSYIFSIIVLSVLLLLVFVLGISGILSTRKSFSINENIQLGIAQNVEIADNDIQVISFVIDGGILPEQEIKQQISVSCMSENSQNIRIKAIVSKNGDVNLVNSNLFTYGDDGFYYFSKEVMSKETVDICSAVIISQNAYLQSNNAYIMTIIVESIDSEIMPTIWKMNPFLL